MSPLAIVDPPLHQCRESSNLPFLDIIEIEAEIRNSPAMEHSSVMGELRLCLFRICCQA
jgi:hypothetical protein